MKPKSKQSLLRLMLTNLFLYCVDMGCAFGGFVFGFGMSVHNWWAVVGFLVLSRWFFNCVRVAYDNAELERRWKEKQDEWAD